MNKPEIVGYAGMLPGAAGWAGKAVNAGWNASNTKATNKAREQMGLEKVGFMKSIGNMFKDQQGQVADVNIGKQNYSVGLEAEDLVGRTTLTPDEANKRAFSNATSIVETPADEAAANRSAFTAANGSWFDKAKQEVGNIFSSFFGRNEETNEQSFEVTAQKGLEAAKAANPSGDTGKFASRPDKPSGNSDKGWGDMSSSERDHARGMSGQVSDSIERGGAGLY
jgi:hypothetical protein